MKRLTIVLVLLLLGWSTQTEAQTLTAATYNVRYDSRTDSTKGNGWQQRSPYLCQLIRFHDFDIFGAQEVTHRQLLDMLDALPGYAYIGVGRDDGKTGGEYSPVFYKKDRFKLLDSGTFWLSETPETPSKGWDAVLPRICSWGHFRDLESGRRFWFFNLHMDHRGVKAREESAKLVLSVIREKCGDEPVILTGDFNVNQKSSVYRILAESNTVEDSYQKTEFRYAVTGTFNSFNPNSNTSSRIDHIFVTPDIRVERYGILTDSYRTQEKSSREVDATDFPKEVKLRQSVARMPSDHFPVVTVLELTKASKNSKK